MSDAAFGHDRNRHGGHDLANLFGRSHAGYAAFGADLRGHALECHHGDGAGFFGDVGLFGVGDVHDDAALEHFGEAGLEAEAGGFRCFGTWLGPLDTFSQARRMGVETPRSIYSTTREGISLTCDDRSAHLPEASVKVGPFLASRARALCALRFALIEMNIHARAETFGTFAITVAFAASGRAGHDFEVYPPAS